MRVSPTLLKAAVLSMAIPAAAFAAETERYTVYTSGKKIGHLTATREGAAVEIDFLISENGRGPRSKERLVLTEKGLPLHWVIDGAGLGGGTDREELRLDQGKIFWSSAAEKGSHDGEPKLYVPAMASPWAKELYAAYALARPEGRAEILPAGTLRASRRESLTLGAGDTALAVEVVALDGLEMASDLVLLDKKGRLIADLGGYLVLRDDYAAELQRLTELSEKLAAEVKSEMHARLAHRLRVPWHVTNVRIFDPAAKRLSEPSTVTVFDDRIVRVAPGTIAQAPEGEKLIDGQGGTLMAGLVDMHAHDVDQLAYQQLAAGVTTIRDMGNDNARLLETIYRQRLHEADGPRVVRAGFLEGKSPFSASAGIVAGSLEEAIEGLHWYDRHGYPYLKTYNSLDPAWAAPLAAEAHRLGMKVLGHVPAFSTADRIIEAGYEEVTHINQLMLQYILKPEDDPRTLLRITAMHRLAGFDLGSPAVRHTIALMKKHGTALDTTIAAMERLNTQRNGVTPPGDHLHLDHMPLMFQRGRRRDFLKIPDEKTDREHFAARDKLVEMVGLLHREGIQLWPGTDDDVAFPIHRELALYVEAGIPAAEVLKIASHDTYQELGLGAELGSIERGKLADFILIPGDPVADIEILRNVSLVVQDGTIYFPAEIYAALNILPFAPAPAIR